MLQKIRFIGSITALWVLTIGTICGLLQSSHLFGEPALADSKPIVIHSTPAPLPPKVISGKPVQLAIAAAGIDLKVDDGIYDESNGTWTLSNTDAQYAVITALANDHAGTTFIYGHGTDAVLGKIGENPPAAGTIATVTTDNGHVFSYALQSVTNMKPNDTSIFDDTSSGAPQLVVQTCTGVFSQWRTMFRFSLVGVQ